MSGPFVASGSNAPDAQAKVVERALSLDASLLPLGTPIVLPPTPPKSPALTSTEPSADAPRPAPPSPSTKPPMRPPKPRELALRPKSPNVIASAQQEPSDMVSKQEPVEILDTDSTREPNTVPGPRRSASSSRSSLSISLRSIVGPPRSSSYTDLAAAKSAVSSRQSSIHDPSPPPTARSASFAERAVVANSSKPEPPSKVTKPSWLRRASMTGSKAKTSPRLVNGEWERGNTSPSIDETSSLGEPLASHPASSAPPALPSRPKPESAGTARSRSSRLMPPPPRTHPASGSITTPVSASSSTGRETRRPVNHSHSLSSSLPREGFGAIRGRLAAWSATAAASEVSFNRSVSPNQQQRLPATAQKALNTAGSAVSRGWAGLRSRGTGAGASISGFSSFVTPPATSDSRYDGLLTRGSADAGADGPHFAQGVMKRVGNGRTTTVFGKDLGVLGRTDLTVIDPDEELDAFQRQRRACLPAVLVRSVEHLQLWAVKEEGIFRISGRSSHISRLKAEFDAGADIDLKACHPGDVDPHAVAGLYKAFLRELPTPILTPQLSPDFDRLVKSHMGSTARDVDFGITAEKSSLGIDGEVAVVWSGNIVTDLERLLRKLPEANWFLLADLASLLANTIDHSHINKMTLQNVLLVFCPSLSFSAPFLRLLIEHRHSLFNTPPDPPLSPDISFDDVVLLPPALPSRPDTAQSSRSQRTDGSLTDAGLPRNDPPRLAKKKSSLSALINPTQNGTEPRTPSAGQARSTSTVQITPPRVELGEISTSPLPSFESPDKRPLSMFEPLTPAIVRATDEAPAEVIAPPPGIVADRAKAFTTQTPIADRFAGTGISAAHLFTRGNLPTASASTGHLPGLGLSNELKNPASVVRRGQPAFFSSSSSATIRPSRSKTVPVNLATSAILEPNGIAAWTSPVDGNKRKSLSPGGRAVRNAVKALESPS